MIPSGNRPVYRYKIELRAATYPDEVWVTVMDEHQRWLRFVDRIDAETEMARRKRIQPHAKYRISNA